MKVKSLGKNQTQVEFERDDKYIAILVSYETPVAALIKDSFDPNNPTEKQWKAYKTNFYYSMTTIKHVNQWLQQWKDVAEEKDQSFFDNLMN